MVTLRLCLLNQKGGCGKSSTCFHLAGAFARSGRSVLLVDADPQGSLSQGFFGSNVVEQLAAQETLAALFDESAFYRDPRELIFSTGLNGVSLIAANQCLADFNLPAPEKQRMQQFAMRDFLDALTSTTEFDVVLIDCPPNLYQCSWNAVLAADQVVIPVPPEDFGTQGLRSVRQCIGGARMLNPRLAAPAHLVTRFDRRLVVHRTYRERLLASYGSAMLETVISELSAYKVALACRQPVEYYRPRSPAAEAMRQLARELLGRAGQQQETQGLEVQHDD